MQTGGNLKRSTITDVAKTAGVSIKTVSRVFNQEKYVRESMRTRVLDAADSLDYVPNPSARSLAARRSYNIGLILENPHEFSYLKRVVEGVFSACEASNYTLLVRPADETVSRDDIKKFVQQSRVEGIVLPAPMGDRTEITNALLELGTPFAQLSPKHLRGDWISVRPNDEEATYELTKYVSSFGHVRIGFIEGDPEHGATERRKSGFVRCVGELGLHADPNLIVSGMFDFESGNASARKLLELNEPPTAIIASNDDMAAGAIVALNQMGLKPVEDVSVVGFDDSPTALRTWPSLTTVRQPIFEMAQVAASTLIDSLAGSQPKEKNLEFGCEIVNRDSLGRYMGACN